MASLPARTERACAIERLEAGGLVRLRDLVAEGNRPEITAPLVRHGVAIRQTQRVPGCERDVRRPEHARRYFPSGKGSNDEWARALLTSRL